MQASPLTPFFSPLDGIAAPQPQRFEVARPLPALNPGTQFDRSVDTIASPTGSGGGGSAETKGAFDLNIAAAGGGTLDVTVIPGTVNGLLPSNYLSTFNISATGLYYLTLSIAATGSTITSASLVMSSSAPAVQVPTRDTPASSFSRLIAIITDGVAERQIPVGSLITFPEERFRTNRTAPAPDESPFYFWYAWT